MGRSWFNNSLADRLAMLERAAEIHSGMSLPAVEKDWWVAATLKALFQCDCSEYLTFKGGTSLSKAYGIINRFSEDIDLAISHSFFGIENTSRSQRKKLRKASRQYIHNTLAAELSKQLKLMGISGFRIENVSYVVDGDGNHKPIDSDKDPTVILLHYPSVMEGSVGYIQPRVKIELSCLSMDEPTEMRPVGSIVFEAYPDEDSVSSGMIRTVLPSRTFLEKMFLLAEEFQKDKPRHFRMSRHLYDLEKLMDTEYGRAALEDKVLYDAIIAHRRTYYDLKYVNYNKLCSSSISFLPPEDSLDEWRKDYENMKAYFIYGEALDFDSLMTRMKELQERAREGCPAE